MHTIPAFDLPLPEDTDRLGQCIALALEPLSEAIALKGLALRLTGNLGAGKTSLVRALLRALGYNGPVKSPTFSLVETYSVHDVTLNHFDFYRFEEPVEFEDAGFRDLFKPATICATEWSDKALPYLPDCDVEIILEECGLGRLATLKAYSELGVQLIDLTGEAWTQHAVA